MQEKFFRYTALLDKESQKTLSGYYDILKQHGFVGKQMKVPYHITLGKRDAGCEKQMTDEFDKVCYEIAPIDINLHHIGLFGLNVLFIEPNMNIELLQLQNRLFDNCGYGYHPWTAHVTLLEDEPDIILKALPIVVENFKPFKAKIESIVLHEYFPVRLIKEHKLN